MRWTPVLLAMLCLAACGDVEKSEIFTVLDARDKAVTERNIEDYSKLLLKNYQYQGKSKFDVVAEVMSLFDQFDASEMKSYDRITRLLDDNHAQCEQSYMLRVQADGEWRQVSQREQIFLTKTPSGWKISGGL